MVFRFKAFVLHLVSSICVLSLVLSGLYFGWYYWPGWYLAMASHVVLVMIVVDVALGPLTTMIIVSPLKPRRELTRDIAVVVTVQLVGLAYGTLTLWQGRPMYYAYSVDRVELVQASDIGSNERSIAGKRNPRFSPKWYDLPRWVWAPLPNDPQVQQQIVASAIFGGDDVIDMPRYFKPWTECATQLRKHLKRVDQLGGFSPRQRATLVRRVKALVGRSDDADALLLTGRGRSVVAIFDPRTLHINAILAAD